MRSLAIAALFLTGSAHAARSHHFSAAYTSRCPIDRTACQVIITNVGPQTQTVKLTGVMRLGAGDGVCGTTYTSLGYTINQVLDNFDVWSRYNATNAGSGWSTLAPGGHVQYLAGGGKSGTSGVFDASIEVQEDRGAVVATSSINSVQDSATPNTQFAFPVFINSGRPF